MKVSVFDRMENIVGKKVKMLVISIFSFSNKIFKIPLPQGPKFFF